MRRRRPMERRLGDYAAANGYAGSDSDQYADKHARQHSDKHANSNGYIYPKQYTDGYVH